MKVEIDAFSGYKIYPSKGRLYVRGDSKVFRFCTSKNESLFLQRKNPRKIAWTQAYRRKHKKGVTEEVAKKRSRRTVKHQRGVAGMDWSALVAKRNQSEQVRAIARLGAIAKAKEAKKASEATKKNKFGLKAPPRPTQNASRTSKQGAKGAGGARAGRY